MHCENLLVNNGGNGQTIEAVRECLPQLDVIAPLAFIIEAIDAVDRCAFVVPAKDEEIFWVFDFVCEKEADGLERLFASINVIA